MSLTLTDMQKAFEDSLKETPTESYLIGPELWEKYINMKFINRKTYTGRGRPKNSDYYTLKPKKEQFVCGFAEDFR